MKKNDEGFTLVELLIVIVILGILATVVVFAVQGITDTGEQNACDVGERTVATAAEAYYAQYRDWPADTTTLVSQGFLRSGSGEDAWSVSSSDGSVSAVTNGSCDI